MDLALLQLLGSSGNGLGSAFGGHGGVQVGQNHGVGGQSAGPVSGDLGAVHDSLDAHLIVGSPVDAGGDDVGVGAGTHGGAVVGNVGHTGFLAGGRSTQRVSVLADQLAAALDQLHCAFLLQSLIVPAAGEGHVHGDGGADGLGTQIEGGVTGNHFGVGESTHIAHLGLFSLDVAGLDHRVQLHTGSDTGQIAALIDGGEGVVVVGQILGVSEGTGAVAELHLGVRLGDLDHVRLMTEAVGKDDVAAGIHQISGDIGALLGLTHVGLDEVILILDQTQVGAGFLGGIDEVLVIGGVFIMQGDEADLDLGSGSITVAVALSVVLLLTAGHKAQSHDQGEEHCKELFHSCFPP